MVFQKYNNTTDKVKLTWHMPITKHNRNTIVIKAKIQVN
jgi:hypothetical protein